jgi:hypothetical protein
LEFKNVLESPLPTSILDVPYRQDYIANVSVECFSKGNLRKKKSHYQYAGKLMARRLSDFT